MELQKAISERRSHRRYTDKKVFPIDMKEILEAGILAPSPKNRQPWYFHLCGPIRKRLIVDVLQDKIAEMQAESTTVGSLPISLRAIEECSDLVLVYNQYSRREQGYNQNRWKADILSIGACVQNMLLAAHSKNIQSLWICDILFADKEIGDLMETADELVAGVAFGIGTQQDLPQRPRMELHKKLQKSG
ncbi:nitroreductase [Desulfosarcina widdelii]|uniref:Nitroreductase n=1 Tax=Desulfosarcina widdelii TaxID=947919 RepID=A0A5K7YZY5_9BACT|nr:nitroreductase family protein [Desulfosarcina widdelii]BBO73985.1 nitroreductase [Desulfosarcina widdelii]